MAGTHLVKKYANRKLYDTVTRRYITLDTVARLVGSGSDVRVIDQSSGKDITAATLDQIDRGSAPAGARSGSARRHPAATRTRRRPTLPTIKGRSGPLTGLIKASLALPASIAQGAAEGLGQRNVLDVFGQGRQSARRVAELNADVADLRLRVDRLNREVERLHGELSELRPARSGAR